VQASCAVKDPPTKAKRVCEIITDAEMQKHFADGPRLDSKWVVALVGGKIYKREPYGWLLLDGPPCEICQEPAGTVPP
jgi:hypothetical protein